MASRRRADQHQDALLFVFEARLEMVVGVRTWEDAIDAMTGEIIGHSLQSDVDGLQADDRRNLTELEEGRQKMDDAVIVAERSAAGNAISGGLTSDNGKLAFVIVVVCGKELKQVVLEPPVVKGRKPVKAPRGF